MALGSSRTMRSRTNPGLHLTLERYPTMVWEVALTQSSSDLAEAAARWIAASLCRVQVVVAIDIISGTKRLRMDLTPSRPNDGEGAGEDANTVGSSQNEGVKWVSQSVLDVIREKGIKEIWCQLWEPSKVEELKTVSENDMNVLTRNDGKRKGRAEPGKEFYCIQRAGDLILKCHAHASQTFKVGWDNPKYPEIESERFLSARSTLLRPYVLRTLKSCLSEALLGIWVQGCFVCSPWTYFNCGICTGRQRRKRTREEWRSYPRSARNSPETN